MSTHHDGVLGAPTVTPRTPFEQAQVTPEFLTIELPHLRVAALAWGPAEGPLVLCLHGYPDTAWTWRHLGPTLATRGYRVVAPFTRGYSPTAVPADGDYHVGALMFDAITLHRHLGGGSDAMLIGHDWGGFTAVALAAHPDSPFTKVVALATPLLYGFRSTFDASVLRALPAQARKSWYVLYQQIPGLPERTLERIIPKLWRDWCPPTYDHSQDLTHVWAALPDRAHRTAALSYYRHQFQPRRPKPQYRALHRAWRSQPYLVPMLVVHGSADGGLDVRLAHFSAGSLPTGSRHEIVPGAGHFVHLDEPKLIGQLIVDHLAANA